MLSTSCPRYEDVHHRTMSRAAGAAALGAVMALVAAGFGTASLYLPGLALLALGIGSALWVWVAARAASVERLPGPHTVEEEQPYPLRLELRTGLLPLPEAELRDALLPGPVPLGGRAPRRIRIDVRFRRRGRRRLEPGRLVVHDPLQLAERTLTVSGGGDELLVLPRIEPVIVAGAGGNEGGGAPEGGGDRAGLRGRTDGMAAELDLDGLRPYRQGTPASRIHWPAVARSGEMLERRLTADTDSAPLVVLDAARPPSEEALDSAVRAAASLCLHLGRHGGCALLLPGERRPVAMGPDLAAWPSLHVRLALVEACSRGPALTRARRAGSVFWVSAAGSAPRDLPRSAAGGGWLVTPLPKEGRPQFTVAGCTGHRLGRSLRAGPTEAAA
jgi:uncharacterized protein (DUF58 family)